MCCALSRLNLFGHRVEGSLAVDRTEAADVGADLRIIVFGRRRIQHCGESVVNYPKFIALHGSGINCNSPKCRDRQNLTARIVDAIMCIFSKLTKPSMLVLLPSCANVISFSSSGMNGMTGGCNLPTDILRVDDKQRGREKNSFRVSRFYHDDFNLNYFCTGDTLRSEPLVHDIAGRKLTSTKPTVSSTSNDKLTCKPGDSGSDLSVPRTRRRAFGTWMEVCPRSESTVTPPSLTFPSQWRRMHSDFGIPCSCGEWRAKRLMDALAELSADKISFGMKF